MERHAEQFLVDAEHCRNHFVHREVFAHQGLVDRVLGLHQQILVIRVVPRLPRTRVAGLRLERLELRQFGARLRQQLRVDVGQEVDDALRRLRHLRVELIRGPGVETEQMRELIADRDRLREPFDVGVAAAMVICDVVALARRARALVLHELRVRALVHRHTITIAGGLERLHERSGQRSRFGLADVDGRRVLAELPLEGDLQIVELVEELSRLGARDGIEPCAGTPAGLHVQLGELAVFGVDRRRGAELRHRVHDRIRAQLHAELRLFLVAGRRRVTDVLVDRDLREHALRDERVVHDRHRGLDAFDAIGEGRLPDGRGLDLLDRVFRLLDRRVAGRVDLIGRQIPIDAGIRGKQRTAWRGRHGGSLGWRRARHGRCGRRAGGPSGQRECAR